jgi:two-component system sensor histidine kinase and response regulator WspE
LSLVRTIVADIGNELYAFPLAKLGGVMRTPATQVRYWENQSHVHWGRYDIPVVWGHQLLGVAPSGEQQDTLDIVVLGAGQNYYGVIVRRLVGQSSLVVQPLDPRLGKVQSISAGSILEDGTPVLILDTDDLVRGMERLVEDSSAIGVRRTSTEAVVRKRILVVDDSITVREVERKLLEVHGYAVEVAFDGVEGWNALRGGNFDLVVTDIDMPRMDGFQLLSKIREDPILNSKPVIIVSYKDREEDRLRGMELGADRYLTKGAFQDEGFIRAVDGLLSG